MVTYKRVLEGADVDVRVTTIPRQGAGGSVVDYRTPGREVGGSKHTFAMSCP